MLGLQQPNFKIDSYDESENYIKLEISPLEKGFGQTLGNAMRRVLLSSLPGYAIYAIKIEGADHEFSIIDGVVEDVTNIVLNLKGVNLKLFSDSEELEINVNEAGVVTAKDIQGACNILNPDHHIATVSENGSLKIKILAKQGRGYVSNDENKELELAKGYIAIDSLYSPVEKVSYNVEKTRVGKENNYDKLTLEVWSNKTLSPKEAVASAAKILTSHFLLIEDFEEISQIDQVFAEVEEVVVADVTKSIEELELTTGTYNALKRAGINTVNDIIEFGKEDISKIKGVGKTKIEELEEKLKEEGYELQ